MVLENGDAGCLPGALSLKYDRLAGWYTSVKHMKAPVVLGTYLPVGHQLSKKPVELFVAPLIHYLAVLLVDLVVQPVL